LPLTLSDGERPICEFIIGFVLQRSKNIGMAARRISLVNFKGGVGKTSITVNLAASLARELDQKVLVVDMDAQSNTSIWLMGVARWNNLNGMAEKSVWGLFHPESTGLKQCIEEEVLLNEHGVERIPKLDLIPSVYKLMDLEHEYQDDDATPYFAKFRMQLEILFDQYQYILFDCPPNVFRATKCALFCSEEVYVPANPDLLSVQSRREVVLGTTMCQNHKTYGTSITRVRPHDGGSASGDPI